MKYSDAVTEIVALIQGNTPEHEIGERAKTLAHQVPDMPERAHDRSICTEKYIPSRDLSDVTDNPDYDWTNEANAAMMIRDAVRTVRKSDGQNTAPAPRFTDDGVVPPAIAEALAEFIELHGHGLEAGNKALEFVNQLPGGRMKYQGVRLGEPYFKEAAQQTALDDHQADEYARAASQIIAAALTILKGKKTASA